MNISSLVVTTAPQYVQEVVKSLEESGVCDVYFIDEKGKIIITIEGETTEEEVRKVKIIEELPHVLTANMMYSYSEEELAQAIEEFQKVEETVPDILKVEGICADEIDYKGDLKGKL
jgi:nitrate reductase NapD